MRAGLKFVVAALSAVGAWAGAIEATDKDLDALLAKGIPTMLDLYASWCGHCKTLAPKYDELADAFAHASDKVQIVKIDADANRKAGKKFKVEYFPTVKWIDANGEEEAVNARDVDGLIEFVTKRTGIKAKTAKKAGGADAESRLVQLNDQNFAKEIAGKDALVAFTATWCGHCKRMKPEYEKLSTLYTRKFDENVLIGNVDCTGDGAKELTQKYGIRGFPTVMFFPADGSDPVPYSGGRDVNGFTTFLVEHGASARKPDGSLGPTAGRVPALDELAAKAIADKAALEKLADEAKKLGNDVYSRIAAKVSENGGAYIKKEAARVAKLVSSGNANADKLDQLQVKLNVLKAFEGDNAKVDL